MRTPIIPELLVTRTGKAKRNPGFILVNTNMMASGRTTEIRLSALSVVLLPDSLECALFREVKRIVSGKTQPVT